MNHLILILIAAFAPLAASARLFTDDHGRQVEADIVGLRGANVVLATHGVRGQWPIARLSPADQVFVKQWQTTSTTINQLTLRIFERDGVGENGAFKEEREAGVPPFPFAPKTETKSIYKHYDLEVNNPAAVDAAYLKVDYVLYVIQPDGTVGTNAGSQRVDNLSAGKSTTVKTEGIAANRVKTTKLKVAVSNNSISAAERTSRASGRFGGCWARVSGANGEMITQTKQLTDELAKLDPPWAGATQKSEDTIPVLKSLDGLLELLKSLPKPTDKKSEGPLPPGLPPKF